MGDLFALIVEDDDDLSAIFAHALRAANFQTEVIVDGSLVMERLNEIIPEIIILDLHLPEKSGIEVLNEIRADSRLENTRIIIASADPRMAEMLEDKVDLVLLKPVSYRQLRDLAVRFHLDAAARKTQTESKPSKEAYNKPVVEDTQV